MKPFAARSNATEDVLLSPISVEGKWGYIDQRGNVVIKPQFERAAYFSERLACVSVAGTSEEDRFFERKYHGFIGRDGEFVIAPKPPPGVTEIDMYDSYSYHKFSEGLARVHVNDATGMDGYIDRHGRLAIHPKFDAPHEFSEGLSYAETWRHWRDPGPKRRGYINTQGDFVIENGSWKFGHSFAEGRAVVTVDTDDRFGSPALINRQGEYVIPPGVYTSISTPVASAIRVVKKRSEDQYEVGIVNLDGEAIVELGRYDYILEPSNGDVFVCETDGKTVLIDASGGHLADVRQAGDVSRFSEDMATIEVEGQYGYIDRNGDLRIQPRYDQAQPFRNGLARVKLAETEGYVNSDGTLVWQTKRWDAPLRNSIRKPLSTFLPDSTVEALPLSYNWERVKNAIVFVADGDRQAMIDWYKQRCAGKFRTQGLKDNELEPEQLDITIYRPDAGFIEVFAIEGDNEEAEGWLGFYSCDNMGSLWKKHPKKMIGIVIEN